MEEVVFRSQEFEGPLDLLLHLISKNKVSIFDVALSQITDQYFQYIERWQKENIEFSSEFLVVASELLYIKSKALLPQHDEDENEEDPEQNLIDRLKEYQLFKLCAQTIGDRQFESKYLFFRLAEPIKFQAKPLKEVPKERLLSSVFALVERKLALKPPTTDTFKGTVVKKTVSIFSKVKDILRKIKKKAKMKYRDLFEGDRSERVASFLALLELIKLDRIRFDGNGETIVFNDRRGSE